MIEKIKKIVSGLITPFESKFQCNDKVDEIINGSYRPVTRVLHSMQVNGEAIIDNGVVVVKQFITNGSLTAENAIFESNVFINGNARLTNLLIKKQSYFSGNMSALSCLFQDIINLFVNESSFSNSEIETIKIPAFNNKKIIQKIYLTHNTIIHGDIIFDSGCGEVYIDNSTTIHGNIVGARVIELTDF